MFLANLNDVRHELRGRLGPSESTKPKGTDMTTEDVLLRALRTASY